ncbi:MAG: hypothetical protein Q9174_003249 [Haloplaca sp. 1 TL-2023]
MHEDNLVNPSPRQYTSVPPTIHLEPEDVENLRILPPSIFPGLDSRPGEGEQWQSTHIPFRDAVTLHAFCAQNDISAQSVVQAAWALLLRCYIGNPSVCFACSSIEIASNDEGSAASETTAGVCTTVVGGDQPVIDIIRGLKCRKYDAGLRLRTGPDAPKSLGHEKVLPANTALAFRHDQNRDWLDTHQPVREAWEADDHVNQQPQVQVIVDISVSKTDFFGTINYRPSVLSVVSAPNVASCMAKAIQEIVRDPLRAAAMIDLFSPRDAEQLHTWNQPFPRKSNTCVHDLVSNHARIAPQSAAVCSHDGDLDYARLDIMSSHLARQLVGAGVGHESLVPVCLRKSLYAVVAMLAILKAGGAFVPLDPSHPKHRLESVIEKAKSKIIVASTETAALFAEMQVAVFNVSSISFDSKDLPSKHPLPVVRPDQVAFVLFTSGSTGKPKGIMQEHASVCTSSLAHGRAMQITSKSRVFQYAAFTFDVSMMDIFTTLICGGCVCIPSEEERMGSFTLAMNRMKVNWALFTPSVVSLLDPNDVPSLQTLALGGEAVKQEDLLRWVGRVNLFNCYGPAECGACAIGLFKRPDSRPANIGRQFGGELCWVIDAGNHNRLLPIGSVGEMAVEGPTLARGYLDDLAKTQASFIKSPPWQIGADRSKPRRVYKTGDLVRQCSDGTFEFVGRKDLQVKVRGQRVEIGEVEHYLSAYPGFFLSVVTRPDSGPYGQSLVGVVQLELPVAPQDDRIDHVTNEQLLTAGFDVEKLLTYLRAKLPSYMVPTHIVIVTKLPLSVSGKIDRRAVDNWLVQTNRPVEKTNATSHSRTSLCKDEAIAQEICSKLLSMVAEPGSPFFNSLDGTNISLAAVGLDSIKVIKLIMFIRQRFGVKLHLDVLMDPKATIRSVARHVENVVAGNEAATLRPRADFMKLFQAYRQNMSAEDQNGNAMLNVFLTGATGFLGSRILRQLCLQPTVRRVMVLVRASGTSQALQRIIETANAAGWWSADFASKVEAWPGDLAKPRLGLSADAWKRLCGRGPPGECVTAIIHNGAKVNWNANFSALKATNVDSTADLLRAASESSRLSSFVFVSGGQQLRVGEDNDVDIAEEIAASNGYAQTKFLSEMMVKHHAAADSSRHHHVSIVKPGFIIGGTHDGLAVVDDYIWRLTAACVGSQSYNVEDAQSWLFISDVDRVAATVTDSCCTCEANHRKGAARIVKILDGLAVSDFWETVKHEIGRDIRPLGTDMWAKRLYSDIEVQGERHPLWPLLQTVEEWQGKIGAPWRPEEMKVEDSHRIRAAIRKNIGHLKEIGMLPKPSDGTRTMEEKVPIGLTVTPFAVSA